MKIDCLTIICIVIKIKGNRVDTFSKLVLWNYAHCNILAIPLLLTQINYFKTKQTNSQSWIWHFL
jgi:hypothetical protein